MSKVYLAAIGDISFARNLENKIKLYGNDYPFEKVKNELQNIDVLFGNQESVLIPENFPIEKCSGKPLQSKDFALEALRSVNFDILHMASNHVLDCGWRGLLHTYNCIRSIKAQPLAAGYNQEDARSIKI